MLNSFLQRVCIASLLLYCGSEVASAQGLKDILGGVVNTVVGNKVTTEQTILGTWNYVSPECKFKGDNLLAQAGSAVAEKAIEEKLQGVCEKVGVSADNFSCEFREDGSYAFTIGGRATEGTYTFDSQNKSVVLKMRLGVTFNAEVVTATTGKSLSLLFDADKMLSLLKTISSVAAKSSSKSTLSTLSSLSEQYSGLKLGFEFEKK
ncbi:MAG: lipocalin-like domain-containing protein [Phocaeicola sp.]